MTELRAIGVDPGPVPGIVVLDFSDPALLEVDVVQCNRRSASLIVAALLKDGWGRFGGLPLVQVERYVVRHRAGYTSSSQAGEDTRSLICELQRVCRDCDVSPHLRAAGNVKPWATDERLDRAGLLAATKGMRHARDAARHALFTAVHDGGIPDPLSSRWAEVAAR